MVEYAFENLGAEAFQALVQALIAAAYPDMQAYPLNQADGGRDALSKGAQAVFQVKFTHVAPRDSAKWLLDAIKPEIPKVKRLLEAGKVSKYIIVTNLRGTGALAKGTIDRVHSQLQREGLEEVQVWWRDDLNARTDLAREVKWAYPAILSGLDAVRALMSDLWNEDKQRRENAVRAFLAAQYDDEKDVRFKQVDLQSDLLSLFIDVPIALPEQQNPTNEGAIQEVLVQYSGLGGATDSRSSYAGPYVISEYHTPRRRVGAAYALTHRLATIWPFVVLEGAPGQGKSTLLQFICQLQRMRLMGMDDVLSRVPEYFHQVPIRIPIKLDLRDLSLWLRGSNPLSTSGLMPSDSAASVESFIAETISVLSGGIEFTVNDVHALYSGGPCLLVLDALDEVADLKERERVVRAINETVGRIELLSPGAVQVIVTSRPSAYPGTIGPAKHKFEYFQLLSVSRDQVDEYAERWIKANSLKGQEAQDIRDTLTERLDEPHVRELARNPMQLAILLALVRRQGTSLPDKRTDFYRKYMDVFFDRESEKSSSVREHRALLEDIHCYIAWLLHSDAEDGSQGTAAGRISSEAFNAVLRNYLVAEGRSPDLVAELLSDITLRVVAITSRIEGTYEFEVQPLREYYAAKYLYETAPPSRVGEPQAGSTPDRFAAIAARPYWLNTARFMAGFYKKGELDSLAAELEELAELEAERPRAHPRRLAAFLLGDWVFAQSMHATRRVVDHVTNDLAWRTVWGGPGYDYSGPGYDYSLGEQAARTQVVEAALRRLETRPVPLELQRALLYIITVFGDSDVVAEWWVQQANSPELDRAQWLTLGVQLNVISAVEPDDLDLILGGESLDTYALSARIMGDAASVFEGDSDKFDRACWVVRQMSRRVQHASCLLSRVAMWMTLPSTVQYMYDVGEVLQICEPVEVSSEACEAAIALSSRLNAISEMAVFDMTASGRVISPVRAMQLLEELCVKLGDSLSVAAEGARIAQLIPRVPSDGEVALFEQGSSWVGVAAYAFEHSGKVAWWKKQRPFGRDQEIIWAFYICAISSPTVIEANLEQLITVVDGLNEFEFDALQVRVRTVISQQHSKGRPATRLVGLSTSGSSRLLRVLLPRLGFALQVELLRRPMAPELGLDMYADAIRLGEALQKVGEEEDGRLFSEVHRLLAAGAEFNIIGGPVPYDVISHDPEAARAIMEAPEVYPSMIINLAERTLARWWEVGQPSVVEIARQQGWFEATR